jgi:hypothetical protein
MSDYDEELGIGALDLGSPVMARVQEMRDANAKFAANCTQALLAGFDTVIIEIVALAGKSAELGKLVESCFLTRLGAYIMGLEFVEEADEKLFSFLDSLCPNKFSETALSENISRYHIKASESRSWLDSLLTDRAEEARTPAKLGV